MPNQATIEDNVLVEVRRWLSGLPEVVFLGLSGGLDSIVLLESLYRLRIDTKVIHVDHGLQKQAHDWAQFCRHQAQLRGFECSVKRLSLASGGNIEARAREARYQAFSAAVGDGVLLTAQHQDDQAETVLLQLMRGAGVNGLSAMTPRSQRGQMHIVRPLLAISRAQIEQLAQQWQLNWVEDPTNHDPQFTRNWLRHQLLPLWKRHSQSIHHQLSQTAAHLQESAGLLDQLAATDLAQVTAGRTGLCVTTLQAFTRERQKNLLRYWLSDKEPYRPGESALTQILSSLVTAKADAQPRLELAAGFMTRHRQRLFWLPKAVFSPPSGEYNWNLNQTVNVASLSLCREAKCSQAERQAPTKAASCYQGELLLPASIEQLQIRFAYAGEKICLNGQHKKVSECWRAANIPPWLRGWLPLFYSNGELVAVAAIGAADGWRLKQMPSSERGGTIEAAGFVRVVWRLPQTYLGQ